MRVGVDGEGGACAAHARLDRPRPVGGQLELVGQSRQSPLPDEISREASDCGSASVAEQLALPEGVVGVLHTQRRPTRIDAVGRGAVGGEYVADEHLQRNAVCRDVMQHDCEYALPCRDVHDGLGEPRGGVVHSAVDSLTGRRRCPRGKELRVRDRTRRERSESARRRGRRPTLRRDHRCGPTSIADDLLGNLATGASTAGNTVRRDSWRSTTLCSAATKAGRSAVPRRRTTNGML